MKVTINDHFSLTNVRSLVKSHSLDTCIEKPMKIAFSGQFSAYFHLIYG